MWERFSPRDGVAIKTNAKLLLECLTPGHECDIKYVEYINEDPNDILSELEEIGFEEFEELQQDLFFYKMLDFQDEREVRILNCKRLRGRFSEIASNLKPFNYYEIKQFMDTNIVPREDILQANIRSMNKLITEIIISPTARPGIFHIVEELIKSLDALRRMESKPLFKIEVDESRRKVWF